MLLYRRSTRSGALQTKLLLPLLIICVTALATHVVLMLVTVPQAVMVMLGALFAGTVVAYYLQVRLIVKPLRGLQRELATRAPSKEADESKPAIKDEIDSLVQQMNDTLQFLSLSEAHFRAIVNTAADGFITFDENGKILWLNRAASKMFGYEPQQAVGKPLKALIPFSENSARNLVAVSTGEIKLFTPKRTVEASRRDASTFPIELSVGKAQVGDRPNWIAVVHDLTGQKRAEEALRLHALTFANISDALLMTDLEGRIIDINPAAATMFGYVRAEIMGQTAQALHPEQATGPLTSQLVGLMGKDGRWFGELQFFRKDGSVGMCDSVIISLRDEQDRRVGTMRVYRDITERKRTEEALQESNRLIRAIIDAFPGRISAKDVKSRYLLMNQFQAELYGTTVEGAVGKTAADLVNAKYGAYSAANDQKVLASGKPLLGYEETIPDAKGRMHTWLTTKIPLYGEGDGDVPRVRGVVNVSVDISDRKRAEEELQQSRANLMALIENTQDAIWWVDPDGRLVTFNSAFRDLARQIWGQEARVGVQPSLWLPRSEQPQWMQNRRRTLAGERLTVEHRWDVNGAPRFWEVSLNPVRVGDEVVGVSVYTRDITERKRAEESRYIRKIAEASPNVMFVVNIREQRIVYSNRQITGALGYTPEEVEQMRSGFYPRMLHPDDLRRLPEMLNAFEKMADGQIVEAEYRMKGTDKSWRWFRGRFTVFTRAASGQVQEVIGAAQDVTELKRGEEQLRSALREKEALLKEVHHRVKNNLQIISSLMNLQAAALQDPGVNTVFTETKNRVRSMALLHETLYRSADLGRIDFPVYVENLCAYLARSYGVDTSRITLAVNVAPISLDLDRALPCGLIVNELVSNSLKYAFPGERSGQVAVELRQADDKSFLLKVSDTGVGLPPEWNEKLATSLGLRLVSDLAKQLRGKLRVGSDGGAHFTIIFPPEAPDHHS